MSLRVGIIGCGTIAQRVYLQILPRLSGVRIVALADVDPVRLATARRAAPDASVYADGHALLAHDALDAVVIASDSRTHAELAVAAFARGLHAYVEKPLASTVADGERAAAAWQRTRNVGLVGFNGRFNPLYGELCELLRAGRAGTPVCIRTVFSTAPHNVPEWKRQRASGGGVLLDLASHHVDLIQFLTGLEVERVHATVLSRVTEHDTALLELGLDSGAQVQSFFSLAASEQDRVEVYGDRARLTVSRFSSLTVDIADNPSGPGGALRRLGRRAGNLRHLPSALRARRAPMGDPGYAAALMHFIDAARGRPVSHGRAADMMDGLRCLKILDAAERSAQSGCVVSLRRQPATHADGQLTAGARF